ncbi:MAG: 1-pyrroline-5-carboxylate dehydrogenase [Candidatus Thiodiazotropha sp.]
MLEQILIGTVYVKVAKNQFQVRHIEDKKEVTVTAVEPFTTKRLLVGEFMAAEKYLKQGVKKVHEGRWFPASPVIVIHPLEMIEGGLSEVEERVLKEVATGAGASKVIVWVGHELSDHEVIQHARNV